MARKIDREAVVKASFKMAYFDHALEVQREKGRNLMDVLSDSADEAQDAIFASAADAGFKDLQKRFAKKGFSVSVDDLYDSLMSGGYVRFDKEAKRFVIEEGFKEDVAGTFGVGEIYQQPEVLF